MPTEHTLSRSSHVLEISVYPNRQLLGLAASARSAAILRAAIAERGSARVLIATGNSQLDVVRCLVEEEVDWKKVHVLHLDEYVGITPNHPASFQHWIQTRFVDKVGPASIDFLNGLAPDPDAEALRYAQLITAGPIDIAFVGIGENGHIAFNDPHVANFYDRQIVKRVALDEACRRQQVGEGHFPDVASVPHEALTVSCSGLLRARNWVCAVPELRKAAAVKASLEGPITTKCPGSLVRSHPRAYVYLDVESASLLSSTVEQLKLRQASLVGV